MSEKITVLDREISFFGMVHFESNKYFKFNRIIDEDNIIIITNNITTVKDNPVLIVDNNKAVYLKWWQVQAVMNYNEGLYTFAIKLNRKYFKPYTFRSNFEDVYFEKEDTFDSLVELAKDQQEENLKFAKEWGKARVEVNMWRRNNL